MDFELFIGRRYLRAKKKQAFISLISLLSIAGVTVGVTTLIVVIAVMTGTEADMKARLLGVQPHVLLMRSRGAFSDYERIVKHAEKMEGVSSAVPFIYTQVMLRSASGIKGAVLKGIYPESPEAVTGNFRQVFLKEESQKSPEENVPQRLKMMPKIILGQVLAKELGVDKGDIVYMIFSRKKGFTMSQVPANRPFEVAGTFESGLHDYDKSFAWTSLTDIQKLLNMGDAVSGIEIRIREIFRAAELGKKIEGDMGSPFWTMDWMQRNRNLFFSLKLQKTVMFIIFSLIVLVAGFSIASTLMMMVIEKTKDIAILKAMGATSGSIRKIFIFKGMVIGLIGTVLGSCLGFALCALLRNYQFVELPADVYYFSKLPVRLEIPDVLLITGSAMVICLLATLYPAHRASGLNPVEGIRNG